MNKKIKAKAETTPVKKRSKRKLSLFGGLFFFIILLIAFYLTPVSQFHLFVFKYIPLPLGQSGGRIFTSYKLPNKSFTSKANFISGVTNAATLNQLQTIAGVHKVSISSQDLNNALDELTQREAAGDSNKFNQILVEQYNSDPKEFKQFWLPLSLYNQNLEVWYNSQTSLNTEGYQIMSGLQNKLNSGADFGELAKNYSQDVSSSQFGGSVGKLELNAILPEFRTRLLTANQGDLLLLPSRFGLHLIKVNSVQKVADTQNNQWLSMSQIFIKNKNFDTWLTQEKNRYPVNYWINF
jgi:hypothetical protein